MINLLTPVTISFDDNYVYIKYQGDEIMDYVVDKNKFEENTGVTISNTELPIPAYCIALSAYAESITSNANVIEVNMGTTLSCGNVIDNLFLSLKSKIDNQILIIDFDGITEVSENFCKQYMQYLLTTKNKVITINQDINVSNIFSEYVLGAIEIQELK